MQKIKSHIIDLYYKCENVSGDVNVSSDVIGDVNMGVNDDEINNIGIFEYILRDDIKLVFDNNNIDIQEEVRTKESIKILLDELEQSIIENGNHYEMVKNKSIKAETIAEKQINNIQSKYSVKQNCANKCIKMKKSWKKN